MILRVLDVIFSAVFIICIPLVLVTSTSRMAVNNPRLYEYGYEKYSVAETTGLESSELSSITQGLIRYFNSPQELTVSEYFNEQEISHLADVKNLLRLFFRVNEVLLMVVFCYVAMGFVLFRQKWWQMLAKRMLISIGLTVIIFAAAGIALAIDFDGIFSWFHRVVFSNLDWLMLPSDMLTKLFPQPFFFNAAIIVIIAVGIECAVIGVISGAYVMYRRKRLNTAVAAGGSAGCTSAGVE